MIDGLKKTKKLQLKFLIEFGLCKFADKIIEMDKGKIAEIGSHTDLIKKNGLYTNLYNEQKKWYN